MKVGFIGLGNMGKAVARNIQRGGFDLIVHDIEKSAAESVMDHGASWADTPVETINTGTGKSIRIDNKFGVNFLN